ncbi:MAG: SIMPL domain-containing protein [Limnobacter sp.]|nr:SIMPL domain-containing protein [Limnobacter sp.]
MNSIERVMGALCLGALLTTATPALAQECTNLPSVSIEALATEEIQNDLVRLNWRAEVEKSQSGQAMTAANKAIDRAIAQIKRDNTIKNIKSNLQTYPVYGKDREIKLWRAVGSLSFESSLSELEKKGDLQFGDTLVLSNLEYFASPQVREESRSRLLTQAMKEFQTKAGQVAEGFQYKGYELASISVNDENRGGYQPPMMRAMSASADTSMNVSEVAASGGSSQMQVSVSGQVCLKNQ